jgi:hypothetical protein
VVRRRDRPPRPLAAGPIQLLKTLDQPLLLRAGEGGERGFRLDRLAQQRLVVGPVERIERALRGEAAIVQLVGQPRQAEPDRLAALECTAARGSTEGLPLCTELRRNFGHRLEGWPHHAGPRCLAFVPASGNPP